MIYSVISYSVIYDALNFYINFVKKYKIHNHFFVAVDKISFYILKNYTLNIFLYNLNMSESNNFDYGSKAYGKIVLTKTKLDKLLLFINRDIILIDIDIYFFTNPLTNITRYTQDLVISLDGYKNANTGF